MSRRPRPRRGAGSGSRSKAGPRARPAPRGSRTKEEARERRRLDRERRAARARRRDRMLQLGVAAAVVVVLAVVAATVWWQAGRPETPAVAPDGVAWGAQRGEGEPGLANGIGVGDPQAPVVVELYEDFLCPHCARFETDAAEVIEQAREDGTARFVYYPVTLDSFGRPSELAANAYACAAEAGRGQAYHDALYAAFGTQWDNRQLVELGRSLGIDSAGFESCVDDEEFAPWLAAVDQARRDAGVDQTPTVFVDGEPLATEDRGEVSGASLRIAIEQAARKTGQRQ